MQTLSRGWQSIRSFQSMAVAGGAIVTLILATGMWLSIERLQSLAHSQLEYVRAEEQEITLAERLRWSVEAIVSTGRGYLITGDAALLKRLTRAKSNFATDLRALKTTTLSSTDSQNVAAVAEHAARFIRVQESIVRLRDPGADVGRLVKRFEAELLPLELALAQSLETFVGDKESTLAQMYAKIQRQGHQVADRMRGLLLMLGLMGAAITAFFARRISTAYRVERDARDAARRALSARDEMMAIVAHDLRNPLYSIGIKAALVRKVGNSPLVEQQAASIENLTQRMDHLIRSMLDVASMEAGRFSIVPGTCELSTLLSETHEVFGPLCSAKGIRFTIDAQNVDVRLRVDKERVLQVLSNLLGNAIKYAPAEGRVELSVTLSAGFVQFSIGDNGPGVPAEHVTHLFDRYWKPEASSKPGTGLGLFIARGIVKAHGGEIWLDRATTPGARFCFKLPCAGVPQVANDAPRFESSPLQSLAS